MWQTVGSDDEEAGGAEGKANSSSSSSSSSDDEEERKKKKKKQKKEHKHKKAKKHKKDKKKKHKKEKKHKHKKEARKALLGAVDQNEYGKYGVIKLEHFYKKAREFEAWLAEVKQIPDMAGMSKHDQHEHFKEFMEDYNTATHRHPKYYDYEKWEMDEYRRKQRAAARQADEVPTEFNDEEALRRERKRRAELEQRQEFQAMMRDFKLSKEKRAEHQQYQLWQAEMEAAYKRGDSATVERLKAKLDPETFKRMTRKELEDDGS